MPMTMATYIWYIYHTNYIFNPRHALSKDTEGERERGKEKGKDGGNASLSPSSPPPGTFGIHAVSSAFVWCVAFGLCIVNELLLRGNGGGAAVPVSHGQRVYWTSSSGNLNSYVLHAQRFVFFFFWPATELTYLVSSGCVQQIAAPNAQLYSVLLCICIKFAYEFRMERRCSCLKAFLKRLKTNWQAFWPTTATRMLTTMELVAFSWYLVGQFKLKCAVHIINCFGGGRSRAEVNLVRTTPPAINWPNKWANVTF